MDQRLSATNIFLTGVESVKPDNLIKRFVSINKTTLKIEKLVFNLSDVNNIYIVGAGKASASMAETMEA